MKWRSLGAMLLAVCCMTAQGCREATERDRYDNRRALASTMHRPVSGSEDERTYRNSRYAEGVLGAVAVQRAEIEAAPEDDPGYRDFLHALSLDLESAAAAALRESMRFSPVHEAPLEGASQTSQDMAFVCRIETLVHVSTDVHVVRVDPVFRDSRPKLIVVYTVQRREDGEVAFKYTSVVLSQWEYGPWAMEDLRLKAVESALAFRDAIREP